MPLYDFDCKCGNRFEAHRALDDASPVLSRCCGVVAVKVISPVALHGASTPKSAAEQSAWTNHGMWGQTAATAVQRETQERLAAGALPRGKVRTMGLAYARAMEMSQKLGLKAETEQFERGLSHVNAESDRLRDGRPQIINVRGRKVAKVVRDSRVGTRHTRHVRYADA